MRFICRAALIAAAIGALAPTFAFCQQFQFPDPDDIPEVAEAVEGGPSPDPDQSPRRNARQRRGWRNSPIVWTGAAVALAVALPFGVYRLIAQMRYASQQTKREKAPWERDA